MTGPVTKVADVRVVGPLAPFVDGFTETLSRAGYAPLTVVHVLRLVAHLSRWLEAGGWTVADLTGARLEEYLRDRRAAGYASGLTSRSFTMLVTFLADVRVLPVEAPIVAMSPVEALLALFRVWLIEERALAQCTTDAYVARARRFMGWSAPAGEVGCLVAGDVVAAVRRESGSVSVGSTQMFVAGVRSFLRFCHLGGLTGSDLSSAALAVTGRRHSFLPNGISRRDAELLLGSCDQRQPKGRRDYAVLLVLLRLGLRASEVAWLTLDDIDWRAGEIVVHGKGQRHDRLPLPGDVGEAIAAYLQDGRSSTLERGLFLRALAPVTGLGRGGVSAIVRHACVRSGIAPVGAHRLRHTVASEMLAAGAPLTEIGQLLRHESIASTAIYARVDIDQLRGIALPWPGSDHHG